MKYLVMTLRKPQFDDSVRAAHYSFLKSLREDGMLDLAGPFTDRSGGAYVIRAESLEQAQGIAEQDPLHIHDCSEVIVREWAAD